MARVVIEIPDDNFKRIRELAEVNGLSNNLMGYSLLAIAHGTVLPKGYGDLIDREVAKEKMREAMCGTGYQHIPLSVLNSEFLTPTVIEADKEKADENS